MTNDNSRTSPQRAASLLAQPEKALVVLSSQPGAARYLAEASAKPGSTDRGGEEVVGRIPAIAEPDLGDRGFASDHGAACNYVVGAMANGITSRDMVLASARAGLLAIFGAAGLSLRRVEQELQALALELTPERLVQESAPDVLYKSPAAPWGVNLIHTPHEKGWERAVVDQCIRFGVPTVSASAYLDRSPEILRLRARGLSRASDGRIISPRRVILKLSRVELAQKFMAPAPENMLRDLVSSGQLSENEAELASQLPFIEDITVEGDSGGHTDNRPTLAQFPAVAALRDQICAQYGYRVRLGLAGGLGTPDAVAAAFALGAAYVLTGSVNQGCVESGSSEPARRMLAGCGQADVAMAPAADMFEMGVNLQVLKRGTMFAMRAQKLYALYTAYPSFEAVPEAQRAFVEDKLFRQSSAAVWAECERYWQGRDPSQLKKAYAQPKHKMALMFRWYLGQASRWANAGVPDRQADYQIWCGPAMGAFNAWVAGTRLQDPAQRKVVDIASRLMRGAAILSRAQIARLWGVDVEQSGLSRAVLPPGR